jgi:exonuclease III
MVTLPLRLVTWNVNGLRAFIARKRREHCWTRERLSDAQVLFECFVKELKLHPEAAAPDVVCLQEIKVQEQDVTERLATLEHPAYPFIYEGYFSFCTRGRRTKTVSYAGVAVYVRCERDMHSFMGWSWQVWRCEEGITGELPARCLRWPGVPRCAREILAVKETQLMNRRRQWIPCWRVIPDLGVGGYPRAWQETGTDDDLEAARQRRGLDEEGRALLLDLSGLILVHVYVPNAGNEERLAYKQQFLACIEARCRQWITVEKRVVVLLGDLNTAHERIDHCNPQEAEREAAKLYPTLSHAIWRSEHFAKVPTTASSSARSPDQAEVGETSMGAPLSEPALRAAELSPIGASDLSLTEEASTPGPVLFEKHPSRMWLHRMLSEGLFRDVFREHWPNRLEAFSCWNTQTQARLTNYGTRIDYILLSRNADAYLQSSACDLLTNIQGSDHCPCAVELGLLVDPACWPWRCPKPCVPLRYRYRFQEKQTSLRGLWKFARGHSKQVSFEFLPEQRHQREAGKLVQNEAELKATENPGESEHVLQRQTRLNGSHLSDDNTVPTNHIAAESKAIHFLDDIDRETGAVLSMNRAERIISDPDGTAQYLETAQQSVGVTESKPKSMAIRDSTSIENVPPLATRPESWSLRQPARACQGQAIRPCLPTPEVDTLTASPGTEITTEEESETLFRQSNHEREKRGVSENGESILVASTLRTKQAKTRATMSLSATQNSADLSAAQVAPLGTNMAAVLPAGIRHNYAKILPDADTLASAQIYSSPTTEPAQHCGDQSAQQHRERNLPDNETIQRPVCSLSNLSTVVMRQRPCSNGNTRSLKQVIQNSASSEDASASGQHHGGSISGVPIQQCTLEHFLRRPYPKCVPSENAQPTTMTSSMESSQPKTGHRPQKPTQDMPSRTDRLGWQKLLSVPKSEQGQRKVPKCYGHKEPAVLRTVKQGPHRGRQFYACRRPAGLPNRGGRCGFFQWRTPSSVKRARVQLEETASSGARIDLHSSDSEQESV